MREIKFRYWNNVIKQMVNDPPMPYKNGWTIEQLLSDRGWVWMQYTGLKDKNGKEIYEGDVVKSTHSVYDVLWDKELAGFVLRKTSGQFNTLNGIELTIIGNVYENPELIKNHLRQI